MFPNEVYHKHGRHETAQSVQSCSLWFSSKNNQQIKTSSCVTGAFVGGYYVGAVLSEQIQTLQDDSVDFHITQHWTIKNKMIHKKSNGILVWGKKLWKNFSFP